MPSRTPEEWAAMLDKIADETTHLAPQRNEWILANQNISDFAEAVRMESALETSQLFTQSSLFGVLFEIITMLGHDPETVLRKYNDHKDAEYAELGAKDAK